MSGLTQKQENGIATLLQTGNVAQSAKIVGVSERQFWRWMDNAEFAAELRRQQDALTSGAFMRLQSVLSGAVDVLTAIMADTSNPPSVRLRAAESVLSNVVKLAEIRDLAQRVAELEALALQPAQAANDYRRVDYRLTLPALAPTYDTGDTETQD